LYISIEELIEVLVEVFADGSEIHRVSDVGSFRHLFLQMRQQNIK